MTRQGVTGKGAEKSLAYGAYRRCRFMGVFTEFGGFPHGSGGSWEIQGGSRMMAGLAVLGPAWGP